MVECERGESDHGLDIARGALHGLLIAIPLWGAFAIATIFVAQGGPAGETASLVLMIAAVGTTILTRPFLRTLWMRRYPEIRSRLVAECRRVHSPLLARQTFALSALTGAYLQFYFLDVSLQIAYLSSVTVFLPVSSMT